MGSADERLYHLALESDWRRAMTTGAYAGSTLGRTLDQEGFVHCSFRDQVRGVADRYYRGRDDVILLEIDPAGLTSEVRVEAPGPGAEAFPHVYGAIPTTAVLSTRPLALGPDGRLELLD